MTPGLIDFHCHIALGVTDFAMPADLVQIPHGVTSLVDAGSVGAANFETFYRNNVANSQMTVKSFLHVSTMGQLTHRFTENIDPQLFDRERIKMLCEQYPCLLYTSSVYSTSVYGWLCGKPQLTHLPVAGKTRSPLLLDHPG